MEHPILTLLVFRAQPTAGFQLLPRELEFSIVRILLDRCALLHHAVETSCRNRRQLFGIHRGHLKP